MYLARLLYPVEVLGPGKRVGLWFSGCPHRCAGCCNPELWEFHPRYRTTPADVLEMIGRVAAEHPIDGFTLSGGDPLFQPAALRQLIAGLSRFSEDILVYTGYRREEIPQQRLKGIAVLIDGPYLAERNNGALLRGSDNQRIHILDPRFEERYRKYLEGGQNRIQNFRTADGVVSVGIHRPERKDETT